MHMDAFVSRVSIPEAQQRKQSIVECYKKLELIGQGTTGKVYRAVPIQGANAYSAELGNGGGEICGEDGGAGGDVPAEHVPH